LNALALVLFLFFFERQVDENLLQLLVHVVNAQLFETVFLNKEIILDHVRHHHVIII
jgi:hypothetical protein